VVAANTSDPAAAVTPEASANPANGEHEAQGSERWFAPLKLGLLLICGMGSAAAVWRCLRKHKKSAPSWVGDKGQMALEMEEIRLSRSLHSNPVRVRETSGAAGLLANFE
jgi:hypothetical protein